ncbi:MAG: regulatory protein RecX [Candidatus Omnitrophica bacterium]|nr:regulatory protein RecX [Candidatus Omnitrophota bacterium]
MEDESKADFAKAKNAALRSLKYRLRSEKELSDKLAQKGFSVEIIKLTLKRLKEIGLLDDRKFADAVISSRLKRPFGKNRIRLELVKKGVDKEIIDEEMEILSDGYDELSVVIELARKRALKYKDTEKDKIKQRIYGYLTRRGFSTYTALKAINTL